MRVRREFDPDHETNYPYEVIIDVIDIGRMKGGYPIHEWNILNWLYNRHGQPGNPNYLPLMEWCDSTRAGPHIYTWFKDPAHAVEFKLRWLGTIE